MKNIRNYTQLSQNIATSGQPTPEQFIKISEADYLSVVNLAMAEHPDAIHNERQLVIDSGMEYFHIPVPFDKPTREHVRIFCKTMHALRGKKVWVHCIMNNRVAAFMFHYLNKVEGLNESESMSPMFESWSPDKKW